MSRVDFFSEFNKRPGPSIRNSRVTYLFLKNFHTVGAPSYLRRWGSSACRMLNVNIAERLQELFGVPANLLVLY